jgi:hypothetical protein
MSEVLTVSTYQGIVSREREVSPGSGAAMLTLCLLLLAVAIALFLYGVNHDLKPSVIAGLAVAGLAFLLGLGLYTLQPNEARVLILFGSYRGTVRQAGFAWGNPFYANGSSGNPQQQAGFMNLSLNWQSHAQVAAQLAPPASMESRASFTVDPTKLPPEAQTIAFEKMGLKIPPVALQVQPQEHEVTEESEGLDPQSGVPVKRKVSVVGKPLT